MPDIDRLKPVLICAVLVMEDGGFGMLAVINVAPVEASVLGTRAEVHGLRASSDASPSLVAEHCRLGIRRIGVACSLFTV